MQLDKYLVSIIIFMVLVLSMALVIPDINQNYEGVDGFEAMDSGINESYYNVTAMYDTGAAAKEKTLGGEISDTDSLDSMIKGAYSSIRLVSSSFKITGDIVDDISSEVGIPEDSYFRLAAKASILIMVIFSLIYLVFRFKS